MARVRAYIRAHLHVIAYLLLAAVLVFGIARMELLNREHQQDICDSAVSGRNDNRAVWERVRTYLLTQTPPDRDAGVNALVDDVLMAIKPLECVDRRPVEQNR